VKVDEQGGRVGAERHVDAVGAKDELVVVRHEPDVDLVVQAHAQEECGFEGGEPAAEHKNLRWGCH